MGKQSQVPSIVLWSWMRTILNLSGNELLIFAYLFSQTFDSIHRMHNSLYDMEEWFGITRQTISRNIDSLVDKGLVVKSCSQDKDRPLIKHNSYTVCTKKICDLCESSDETQYANFLESYSFILKQKYPNDCTKIDDYIQSLSDFHANKDMEIKITVNELAKLICGGSDGASLADVLNSVRKDSGTVRNYRKTSYIENTPKQEPVSQPISLIQPPKRQSRRSKKNEWDEAKRQMVCEFVYYHARGNSELQEILNQFLDTDNGRSYNPTQWQQQLDNLYNHGRTIQRMIDGVRNSYMNNYKTLFIVDKSEVDIDAKITEAQVFVRDYAENNQELLEYLVKYITEVPRGKSYKIGQFRLALKDLAAICPTVEQKISSVKRSYTYSYASLAYSGNQVSNTAMVVDIDAKMAAVDSFIANGYYQLCDGLGDALKSYIENTDTGKSCTLNEFSIMLNNLRLFCVDDADKVIRVQMATKNNYNKFATEDYAETARFRERHETRESIADGIDRSRKARVMQHKRRHPDDPRLVDIILERPTGQLV